MNVVLGIDHLLYRDESTTLFDVFLNLYPDANIVTLVFHEGKVLGQMQLRKIGASYLSHMIKDKEHWDKKEYLIPSSLKSLEIPENTDLLLTLSRGYIHGLKVPKNTRHISYIYELDQKRKPGFINKVFRPYLKSWQQKSLKTPDHILWSSDVFAHSSHIAGTVVHPGFGVEDFPLFTDENFNQRDTFIIKANNLSFAKARELAGKLIERNKRVVFYGDVEALSQKLTKTDRIDFFGSSCSGEFSHLLREARGYIDLNQEVFPVDALSSLTCGVPCLVLNTEFHGEYIDPRFGCLINNDSSAELDRGIDRLLSEFSGEDRKSMRRHALRFNKRNFKLNLQKAIDSFLQ